MSLPTIEELPEKKIPELVKLYNELSGKKLKTFKDKPTAIERVSELLAQRLPPAQSKTKGGVRRKKRMSYPPMGEVKNHRAGTKRARVIQMLSRKRGATFAEIQDEIGWDYATAYEGVKLLHTYLGYGLEEDDQGRIRLLTE